MKKLLVTGISGFLGWHLVHHPQSDWEVCGIYHNNKPDYQNINLKSLDLTDNQAVIKCLDECKPDAILHFAANSNPNNCEQNPLSRKINVDAPVHLAEFCATRNIPFLFTSTDLVFDGKNAPYSEFSPINPIMNYGKQKALAEQKILSIFPKAIIARMPLMYGLPPNGLGFMNAWMRNLKEGKNVYCFTDEYRTTVSGNDAIAGILLLLKLESGGVFHLGGTESMTRFEFANQMAKAFGLDESLIIPSLQKDVQMPAKRPANVSLDSQKAFSKGYSPRTLKENLADLVLTI